MSRTKIRVSAVVLTLRPPTAACASDDSSGGGDGGHGRRVGRGDRADRLRGPRPVGRRAVRRGEGPAGDRADDGLRVAGALARGPGDRARGVRRGVQRARWRQRRVHRGPHLRRRRQRRPGARLRAGDRRGRRGRDGQRPGHRRPGRGVGGHGRRRGSPGSRRTSPTRTGATRTPTRSTRRAPASSSCCRRRSSRRTSTEIGDHPGRPGRGVRARSGSSRTSTRARRHLPLRRRRFRRAPPTTPSSSSARRRPGRGGRRRWPSASRRPSRSCGPASSWAPSCSIGASLGTFSHATVAELGDFADQMVFLWSYPAGDLRPPGLRGAPRRPGGLGRGGAAAREPQGQPDALVDRPLRAAQDDPRQRG